MKAAIYIFFNFSVTKKVPPNIYTFSMQPHIVTRGTSKILNCLSQHRVHYNRHFYINYMYKVVTDKI